MKLLLDENLLLTFDKNLQFQQNFDQYRVPVLLLTARSNQYLHLLPLVDAINQHLDNLMPGVTIIK